MKHYGDVSAQNGANLPPVDIITFGSPCQDMSVAGKRSGLDGERSSLFYQAVRIVKEMRCKTNGKYPRFVVWENVQGAFSSNKGEDFRAVPQLTVQNQREDYAVPELPNGKWDNAGCIMQRISPSHGGCSMRSIGEFPNAENASTLSQS